MVDGRWLMVDGRWSMVDGEPSSVIGERRLTHHQGRISPPFDHQPSSIDHRPSTIILFILVSIVPGRKPSFRPEQLLQLAQRLAFEAADLHLGEPKLEGDLALGLLLE